jgi:effector-binding domain-containing protein
MDYEVTLKETASEHLASVRGIYPISQLAEAMPKAFAQVMKVLTAQGVQPSGGAITVYHGWSSDTVDAEIGFTIRGVFFPQEPKGAVRASRIPGGRVLFAAHVGPYEQLEAAYRAIQAYAEENGLQLAETMWEKYLTDPAQEPDLTKHLTEVYWPVA